MDDEKKKSMREIIREEREKDGYTVIHKFLGKCSIEECFSRMIKSHTQNEKSL